MNKTKIVTIWGWNGQSNLLDALYTYYKNPVEISSIVSMSDDGRTTWELMRKFEEELDLHLPPPWDLRRCLFMMSASEKRDEFQQYMETVIERDFKISELTLWDYFQLVWADESFKQHLENITTLSLPKEIGAAPAAPFLLKRENWMSRVEWEDTNFLNFTLPLTSTIKWHKVWNILMANLYYNLGQDYNAMLKLMHKILEVEGNIIPVTTKKAFIRAVLGNGQVVETQDRISNVAAYTSGIADLELMEDSQHAYQHKDVFKSIKEADYILIGPGDLFTSTISNFVIGWVKEVIQKTNAKIIYIWNSTNKWGETQWLTSLDFLNKIERFLWRTIDIFICNNKRLEMSESERERFQNDISVKWGDFLYLSNGEKDELKRRKIQFYEADLLDRQSFYKHDKKSLAELLEQILS